MQLNIATVAAGVTSLVGMLGILAIVGRWLKPLRLMARDYNGRPERPGIDDGQPSMPARIYTLERQLRKLTDTFDKHMIEHHPRVSIAKAQPRRRNT